MLFLMLRGLLTGTMRDLIFLLSYWLGVIYFKLGVRFVFGSVLWHINPCGLFNATFSLSLLYIYIYISKVGNCSQEWPKSSLFNKLLHQAVGEGTTPFPRLLHFTFDLYLIMLSVKHFFETLVWLDLGLNPGLPALTTGGKEFGANISKWARAYFFAHSWMVWSIAI